MRLSALPLILAGLLLGPAAAAQQAEAQVTQATAPVPDGARLRDFRTLSEQWPKLSVSADGTTLYLIGPLVDGSYVKFAKAARAAPKLQRVYLGSEGGLTTEGRLIAAMVIARRLDTYVEHLCASSCTQVFVAGKERVLGPKGLIGFHQSFALSKDGRIMSREEQAEAGIAADTGGVTGFGGNASLRLAYQRAGIEPAFITRILETPGEELWTPGHDELAKARVVHRLPAAPEVPAPAGFDLTRADVAGRLLAQPLWQGIQRERAPLFEASVDSVWRDLNIGIAPAIAEYKVRYDLYQKIDPLIATAPEPLLDRFLTLVAATARAEREGDYPSCTLRSSFGLTEPEERDAAFDRQHQALLGELLSTPGRVKLLDPGKAEREFAKTVAPVAAAWADEFEKAGQAGQCRLALRLIEIIDGLEPKKRLRGYRALLALPD